MNRIESCNFEAGAAPAAQVWIPVSECRPAMLRTVLVAYESDDDGEPCLDVDTATIFPDGKWHGAGIFYAMGKTPPYEVRGTCNRVVTHWMPLPAPPEVKP